MHVKNPKDVSAGLRLQVIRSVLQIPAAEAASMFSGMTEDMWVAMENGEQPPPDHVTRKLDVLFSWRNHQLAMTRQLIANNPTCHLSEFWHRSMDDWMAIDEREPEHFRVTQSLVAALATEYPAQYKVFPFDLAAFTTWADGRHATEELQAQYLGEVTEPVSSRPPTDRP